MWALCKIISGGQTGADKTALVVAKELGYETGGYAPRHYKTEDGSDWSLKDEFGLSEMPTEAYRPRTWRNVKESDGTVWFGTGMSPGFQCTWNAIKTCCKPYILNPDPLTLKAWLIAHNIVVLNVAGHRRSTHRETEVIVRSVLEAVLKGVQG